MRTTELLKVVAGPNNAGFRHCIPACRELRRSFWTASTRHTSRPSYNYTAHSRPLDKNISGTHADEATCSSLHKPLGQRSAFSTVTKTDGPGTNWRRKVVGCQPFQNLKVGPYKRGKWFVSYKDDPGSFITNILILVVTGYSIFTMMPGESMKVRRQRKLRQVLLDNAQMTEADLMYIENYRLPEEDK